MNESGEHEARMRSPETASDLFYRHGIPTGGVDRIVAEAGSAKMTLYKHVGSKDELVVAVLDSQETQVFDSHDRT